MDEHGGSAGQTDLPGRIKEAARRSGKPLEVLVARSFLQGSPMRQKPWRVTLGSYFADELGRRIRELDVMAECSDGVSDHPTIAYGIRAIVSCKGLPPDKHPVTYSIKNSLLPGSHDPECPSVLDPPGKYSLLGAEAVQQVFSCLHVHAGQHHLSSRSVVGFDVFNSKKGALDNINAELERKGDRPLFEALDSAVRATVYWSRHRLAPVKELNEKQVLLLVPMIVLPRPWHDIPIDDGQIGTPTEQRFGSISLMYPADGAEEPPSPIFCLVVAAEELPEAQIAFTNLAAWLKERALDAYRNPR